MSTIEELAQEAARLERDMKEQARITYDKETPANMRKFWEAFKAYQIALGAVLEARRNQQT